MTQPASGASAELLAAPFATLSSLIRAHAAERPERQALIAGEEALTYEALDRLLDRFAAGARAAGLRTGDRIGVVGANSIVAAIAFLGALRAGCVPVPISTAATPVQMAAMLADAGASLVFADPDHAEHLAGSGSGARIVPLDGLDIGLPARTDGLEADSARPEEPFNIIYSSGTTGAPKGIVQSHQMRWNQIQGFAPSGFDQAVTLISTPLCSNTTLVTLLPTLAHGGTVVLMAKFEARAFLEAAERHRATHTMLVPVQYQRIMAVRDFDRFDLASFVLKMCTSAPFSADLKADVLRRWPGYLVEFYGMTEGGGTCTLIANETPDKLHTVGRPAPGHDVRIIDPEGREVPSGEIGEVVGRSSTMMSGYHRRPDATSDATWTDAEGQVFIRHGDLGYFDADGFLILVGRAKDMIISGGFNVYPADLEVVLDSHPQVSESAVVGVPSERWGETPFAYFVPADPAVDPAEIVAWVNARLASIQRLSGAEAIPELPRNHLGKVMKSALRDRADGGRPKDG